MGSVNNHPPDTVAPFHTPQSPANTFNMGLLASVVGPLVSVTANFSATSLILTGLAALLVLSIVLNVLNQLLFRNPSEPPVVFHLLPVLGSTIPYGIDPYKFFFRCREKVGRRLCTTPSPHLQPY